MLKLRPTLSPSGSSSSGSTLLPSSDTSSDVLIVSRIQDQTDFTNPPVDDYFIKWDAGTQKFIMAEVSIPDVLPIDLTADVTGVLPIANGGTGQTTAANAINALLPSQTGNAGEFLTTNGTVASWASAITLPFTLSTPLVDQDDLPISELTESNSVDVVGQSQVVYPVSIRDGEINVNSTANWHEHANLVHGDTFKLRGYSSAVVLTANTINVHCNGATYPWVITTGNVAPANGYTGWWQSNNGYWSDNGSTPAVNGGYVYRWDDSSGNGRHLVQATLSQRGMLRTNYISTYSGVEFDNTLVRHMQSSSTNDNTATLVVAGKFLSNAGSNPRLCGYGQQRSIYNTGTEYGYYQSGAGSVFFGGTPTVNQIFVIRMATGVAHMARRNGANTVNVTTAANPTNSFGIGSNGGGTEHGHCIVYEALHYPFILSDAEAMACEEYLNYKFNVY